MGLRDIGESLPPGFRFYPSDEELVCHYLYKKITNEEALKGTLVEIDLHTCEPWQLPEVAKLNTTEWYFFSFRDRKYATGFRTNRATTSGYWKATGKDRIILDPSTRLVVGMRKTLVFYRNRAPNGIKTGWIMHEFRLESPHMPPKEDWVLCRVFHKGKGDHHHDHENNNTNNYHASISSPTSPPTSTTNHDHHHHHQQQQHQTAHTHPCGSCTQQQSNSLIISSNNPSSLLLSSLNPNFHVNNNHDNHNYALNNNIINPNHNNFSFSDLIINSEVKNDDDYGFLWDMDLEDHSNKLGEPHDLGDVRFDHDDQDDGGIVFF